MLQPKKTKYRKAQKGRMKGNSGRGHRLSNGMFGIKSLDSNFLTSRQIEAARIAATRYMKREGQLWIKIFPDKAAIKGERVSTERVFLVPIICNDFR